MSKTLKYNKAKIRSLKYLTNREEGKNLQVPFQYFICFQMQHNFTKYTEIIASDRIDGYYWGLFLKSRQFL